MSFYQETLTYIGRMNQFKKVDWQVYTVWIGLMVGLLGSVLFFLLKGASNGVEYPAYVWNIPLGIAIFATAISIDTIGHRTIYKEELEKAEALVHHITIFAGITSTVMLCLCYTFPVFLKIPTYVMVFLSVLYSIIDEGFHWHRYWRLQSDRVEMWSHFFIFVGHNIMVFAWVYWCEKGYPGVAETLAHF